MSKSREELVKEGLEDMANARARIMDLVNLYNKRAEEIGAHSRIGMAVSESEDHEDESEGAKHGAKFIINPDEGMDWERNWNCIEGEAEAWFPSGLNC